MFDFLKDKKNKEISPKDLWRERYADLHSDTPNVAANTGTSGTQTPAVNVEPLPARQRSEITENTKNLQVAGDDCDKSAMPVPAHNHVHAHAHGGTDTRLLSPAEAAKQRFLYILTIFVSCLIVIGGHLLIDNSALEDLNRGKIDLIPARVERIIKVESSDSGFDVGKSNTLINFSATLLDGDNIDKSVLAHQSVDFNNPAAGVIQVAPGDKVLLVQTQGGGSALANYAFVEFDRSNKLLLLAGLFVLGILLFGRFKGLNTIFSLGLTIAIIFLVLIPAIFAGYNIYLLTLLVCLYAICMSFFLVIGYNAKSYAASIGCFAGVAAAGLLALLCNRWLQLSGITGEETITLGNLPLAHEIDLKALIFATILIGALGAVMDVAMDITAALAQVKIQAPDISALALYKAGMDIGRDLLVTLSNTLIMAYVGASLAMVLVLYGTGASLHFFLNREAFAVEILNAIIGTLAILLTIPLTSAVCAVLFSKKNVKLQ